MAVVLLSSKFKNNISIYFFIYVWKTITDIGKDWLEKLYDGQWSKSFVVERIANTIESINDWLYKTNLADT